MKKHLFVFITIIALSLSLSVTAFAQVGINQYKGKISSIQLKGLRLISKTTLFSNMLSTIGEELSPKLVSDDIKNFYKLGYFKDIQAEVKLSNNNQILLTFTFQEVPQISSIVIEGNDLITDDTLNEKLNVYIYNMLDLSRVDVDVKALEQQYREDGYFNTKVSYEIRPLNKNEVQLAYVINETPRVYLTDINITGSKFFYPLDLKRRVLSTEIDCFNWFSSTGVFNEDLVNQDLQVLTQTYLTNGFIKINIDKPEVKMIHNPDFSRVEVNIHLTEGEQYFTGSVKVVSADGNPLLVEEEKLVQDLNLVEGNIYNPFKQNQDRVSIADVYQERGYAFSRVWPTTNIHEDTKKVDVVYNVVRGEKAYIGRVEIHGNNETRDYVVRRELEVHDNELYNGVKLRKSQSNISRLGFFNPGTGVQMQRMEGSSENDLDYNFQLEETQTGSFTASLTYSEYSGTSVQLAISKRNFLGRGQSVSLKSSWADKGQQNYTFRFYEPYTLDTKFSSDLTVEYDYYPLNDDYDSTTNGFSYTLGIPFWKDWRYSIRYAYRDIIYSNVTAYGEELLEGEEDSTLRSLRTGATYSTVNHPTFPSEGFDFSIYGEEVGGQYLGGEQEFRRYDLSSRFFHPFNEAKTVVFMAKATASQLFQSNSAKNIPTTHRFEIGGITTVRGFDWYEIEGPTSDSEVRDGFSAYDLNDPSSDAYNPDDYDYYNSHYGGMIKRIINLELLFPLTREGQNMRGVIFYDMGNVWSEDRMYEITGAEKDYTYFRKSWGIGARFITPMGVLRFEYGQKLDQQPGESPGKFDFHISGLF